MGEPISEGVKILIGLAKAAYDLEEHVRKSTTHSSEVDNFCDALLRAADFARTIAPAYRELNRLYISLGSPRQSDEQSRIDRRQFQNTVKKMKQFKNRLAELRTHVDDKLWRTITALREESITRWLVELKEIEDWLKNDKAEIAVRRNELYHEYNLSKQVMENRLLLGSGPEQEDEELSYPFGEDPEELPLRPNFMTDTSRAKKEAKKTRKEEKKFRVEALAAEKTGKAHEQMLEEAQELIEKLKDNQVTEKWLYTYGAALYSKKGYEIHSPEGYPDKMSLGIFKRRKVSEEALLEVLGQLEVFELLGDRQYKQAHYRERCSKCTRRRCTTRGHQALSAFE